MTTAAEIPFGNVAQTFTITLGANEYRITQRYCEAAQAWFCDIAQSTGEALLSGLMLVTGADLLSQFAYLGIAGRVEVQSDGDVDAVPTFDNLGGMGHAYFVTD